MPAQPYMTALSTQTGECLKRTLIWRSLPAAAPSDLHYEEDEHQQGCRVRHGVRFICTTVLLDQQLHHQQAPVHMAQGRKLSVSLLVWDFVDRLPEGNKSNGTGQRATDDLFGSFYDPLNRLSVLSCGACVPHTQTVHQYALHQGVIEGQQQLCLQVILSQEVEPL
ncbi:hypothetical protein XENOCAPTIV_013205, partial [Xenoophorus captivus]